jgi:hypothetical protein
MRIGGLFVTAGNQGAVGRLSQNDYKKILNASCKYPKKRRVGSVFEAIKIIE